MTYIKKRKKHNLKELAKNLNAEPELLVLVLESAGYTSADGINYCYDEKLDEKIKQERQKEIAKESDKHGTDVNCYSMNEAVQQLNFELLYYAVLLMEQGNIENFESKVKVFRKPLEKYQDCLEWDENSRCVRIAEVLPEGFDGHKEAMIYHDVLGVRDIMHAICLQMENFD